MKRLFLNILYGAPQNTSDLVLYLVVGVWLVVWLLLIMDIIKQNNSFFSKIVWLAFCSVPIIGASLYSIRELIKADWSSAFSIRRHDAGGKSAKTKKN